MQQGDTRRPRFAAHRLVGVLVLAVVLAASCRSGSLPTAELADLRHVDELKAQFNRDAGSPRMVLLLSPT